MRRKPSKKDIPTLLIKSEEMLGLKLKAINQQIDNIIIKLLKLELTGIPRDLIKIRNNLSLVKSEAKSLKDPTINAELGETIRVFNLIKYNYAYLYKEQNLSALESEELNLLNDVLAKDINVLKSIVQSDKKYLLRLGKYFYKPTKVKSLSHAKFSEFNWLLNGNKRFNASKSLKKLDSEVNYLIEEINYFLNNKKLDLAKATYKTLLELYPYFKASFKIRNFDVVHYHLNYEIVEVGKNLRSLSRKAS